MPPIEPTSACSAIRSRTIKDMLPLRHTLRSAEFQKSQMHLCVRLPALVSSFRIRYSNCESQSSHAFVSMTCREILSRCCAQLHRLLVIFCRTTSCTIDELLIFHYIVEQIECHFDAIMQIKLYPGLPYTNRIKLLDSTTISPH
jgi:hypothetical protein